MNPTTTQQMRWPPKVSVAHQWQNCSPNDRRRRKFEAQGGICYWFIDAQRNGYKHRCPHPLGKMTLQFEPSGKPGPDYATFEHLQRRRDGGAGKPNNVVLACRKCNTTRDAGMQLSKPKPENVAAQRRTNEELLALARTGVMTQAEFGQFFSRGLAPNWPMWSKFMASEPLGPW